jgi:hypothetical protein
MNEEGVQNDNHHQEEHIEIMRRSQYSFIHVRRSGRTALGNRKEGMEEQMMCITNIEDKGFSKQTCLLLYE